MSKTLVTLAVAVASAHAMVAPPTNTSAKPCTGDCAHVKMMEEKRMHFAECRAISEATHGIAGCPTLRPSISSRVPCEGGASGEYACENVDLLSYVGMEELGSSETNDMCVPRPRTATAILHRHAAVTPTTRSNAV
eukprot:SAG11_NODE_12581_length_696_cov_0.948074_2_plen_136_part_00